MSGPVRRNFAHLTDDERQAYVNAVRQLDLQLAPGGVSWWDKQDEIHQATHHHGGPTFIPWHRELVNRYEKQLQTIDPDVAAHYWDWNDDPRSAPDGDGGTVDYTTDALMGTANGVVAGTLEPLHNGDVEAGSRGATGNPADPPRAIRRFIGTGAPSITSDGDVTAASNGFPQAEQWHEFREALEDAHDAAHGYFGIGSNIQAAHAAFEDPFVFLLHANVDRLFAMWQAEPGQDWRLDPGLVYGNESTTAGTEGILTPLSPWNGDGGIRPWTPGDGQIEVKNSRHPSVVAPPCYDTLPLSVSQIVPVPPQPMRFLDIPTGQMTARALRLRVRGCQRVTVNASVSGDPAFTVPVPTVTSPETDTFGDTHVLVWVQFTAGAVGTTPSATLTATVAETGEVFSVPITSNVIEKPTVAVSLVLDRSGSMSGSSGIPGLTRLDVLKAAAPQFVALLPAEDAIGVVHFDTDAVAAGPAQLAGPIGPGPTGRNAATTAIAGHVTDPLGMTSIGDGVVTARNQLAGIAGFTEQAMVVFTDGHETEPAWLADVAHLIDEQVFAIGLGTAEQLDPATLSRLADDTDGYLLLTGPLDSDSTFRLQKYFLQVLAGVTNTEVVTDPDDHVGPHTPVTVPIDLTEADHRLDAIVLTEHPDAIRVSVEAPDGTVVAAGSGAEGIDSVAMRALRVELPPAGFAVPVAGTWKVHVEVERDHWKRLRSRLADSQDRAALERLDAHGLLVSVNAHAESSLRFEADVVQSSRTPGSTVELSARVVNGGIPLARQARVEVDVTSPSGSPSTLALTEDDDSTFAGAFTASAAGVYQLRFRAAGTSLQGSDFTREALRTAAVWSRGDDPGPTSGGGGGGGEAPTDSGLCGLLKCLAGHGGLKEIAERLGVDHEVLLRCLEERC